MTRARRRLREMVATYATTTIVRMVDPRSAPLPSGDEVQNDRRHDRRDDHRRASHQGRCIGPADPSGANAAMLARIASEPSAPFARSAVAKSPLPSSAIPAARAHAAATVDVDAWVNG